MKKFIIIAVLLIGLLGGIPAVHAYRVHQTQQTLDSIASMLDAGDHSCLASHGLTIERDAWGNRITWEVKAKRTGETTAEMTLTIRSCGFDGKPDTDDDIIVQRIYDVDLGGQNNLKAEK